MRSGIVAAWACAFLLSLGGCADIDNGYRDPYRNGYDRDPYYGGGYYDDRRDRDSDYWRERERERNWEERRRIEQDRDRMEDERRRLERERREREEQERRNTYRPPAPPRQESCPPGFSPSEQKCSPEERRRGCKDIRLNSGLGCVKR